MDWMEYTILTTTEGSDLVSQILMDAGSTGTMIEDKNDVAANQRPEGQWDIIDEAIARRIGDYVKVTGYFEADAKLPDRIAARRNPVQYTFPSHSPTIVMKASSAHSISSIAANCHLRLGMRASMGYSA